MSYDFAKEDEKDILENLSLQDLQRQFQAASSKKFKPTPLFSTFPGLIPLKDDLSLFRGSVKFGNDDVEIELSCSSEMIQLRTADSEISKYYHQLQSESPELFAKISSLKEPNRFLHELISVIETFRKPYELPGTSRTLNALAYQDVLEKIQSIGREYFRNIHYDSLVLGIYGLEMTYSISEKKIKSATVPLSILRQLSSRKCGLLEAFNLFKESAENLQYFYNSLKSLDESTCVLDPSDPRQAYRRVALEKCAILQITFLNPLQAGEPPLLELFGCQSPFKDFTILLKDRKWHRKWNPKVDVLSNLTIAFGDTLKFLSKEEDAESSIACAICYSYLLGEQTPKVFCENVQCHRPYHEECFRIWALEQEAERGLRRAVLSAPCVYCEKQILLSVSR